MTHITTHMRTVQDILNSKTKSLITIKPDTLVYDALQMLNTVNLSYLVVLEGDEYKGVFCERDYSRNVVLKGKTSHTATVAEVMTVHLPFVDVKDTVEHCMNVLNSHKVRYLLAHEGRNFKGVITINDLLRQVIDNREDVFD